jgi:hypothetical protein
MVDDLYKRLKLNGIIRQHKSKGIALDALVRGIFVGQLGNKYSILKRAGGLTGRRF